MRQISRSVAALSLVAAVLALATRIDAQTPDPRRGFTPLRVDGPLPAPLARRVDLALEGVTLDEAVREIARQADLSFTYDRELRGLDRTVRLRSGSLSAGAALVRVLEGSSIEALVSDEGQVVLVSRSGRREPHPDAGIVRGTVHDTAGAAVGGAIVELVGTRFATTSRIGGDFALRGVPPGEYALRVLRLGFRALRVPGVHVTTDSAVTPLDVSLYRAPVPLSAVVVTPGFFGAMSQTSALPQTLTRQQIETLPQLGEDIYRAVSRLPGVTATDYSAKFYVRGGTNDELYVTLDGLELSEPFHLKDIDGALSILDIQSIGSVELTTGGFGAEYGNRLTGVFNLQSVEPVTSGTKGALGVSLMGARAMAQGGFSNGRGGWLASARRGYLDLALRWAAADDSLKPRYYDAFAKVHYDLPGGGRVALHALHAGDELTYLDAFDPSVSSRYASTYGWLTFDGSIGGRLHQRTVASVGRLTWRRDGSGFANGVKSDFIADRRWFRVAGLRQDWSLDLGSRALLKWGVDVKHESADYDYLKWSRREVLVDKTPVPVFDTTDVQRTPSAQVLGAYVAQRVRPWRPLTLELGARYDRSSAGGGVVVSPRFNAAWTPLSGTTLRGAWGRYSQAQPLYALQVQDGIDHFFPAELAEHRVVSIEQSIRGGLTARLEGYDRRLTRVHPRFVNLGASIEVFPELAWDRTRIDPTSGNARGVELFLKHDLSARVDWSASYAIARAEDEVGGRIVPRSVDQRHTAHLDWAFRPASNRWRVSAAWLWRSGWPYTPAIVTFDTLVNTPQQLTIFVQARPGAVNSARLPEYRRFDVRATRYFDLAHGRLAIFAEMFNLFNSKNPRGYHYNLNNDAGRFSIVREYATQLPRIPAAGISWEF